MGGLSSSMISPLNRQTIVEFTWWLNGRFCANKPKVSGEHTGQLMFLLFGWEHIGVLSADNPAWRVTVKRGCEVREFNAKLSLRNCVISASQRDLSYNFYMYI